MTYQLIASYPIRMKSYVTLDFVTFFWIVRDARRETVIPIGDTSQYLDLFSRLRNVETLSHYLVDFKYKWWWYTQHLFHAVFVFLKTVALITKKKFSCFVV